MMKRLFFFTGLPCSGKSFAAKLIADKLKATYISTGDIARKLTKTADVQTKITQLDLFPGEEELREELRRQVEAATTEYVVVDGFPRFGDQVEYLINNFWVYMPTIIEISVGDQITLINRAKFRSRDGRDEFNEFMVRLTKASANMSTVHQVMSQRLVPNYTIMSGDADTILKSFNQFLKVK